MRAVATVRAIVIGMVTMAVVGGCGGAPGEVSTALPILDTREVPVPDVLLPTKPQVFVGAMYPGGQGAPLLVGGIRTEPDGSTVPTSWISDDGTSWRTVDIPVSGSLANHAVRANAALGFSSVRVSENGRLRIRLRISTDREHWSELALSDDFAGRYSTAVSAEILGDDRVVLIGVDEQGAAAGRRVYTDGRAASIGLPALAPGSLLKPTMLVSNGSDLVLLATPSARDAVGDHVAYRSSDGGATWSAPTPVTEGRNAVKGLVFTGTEYVATGSVVTDPASGQSAPAAWHSRDGANWEPETVPPLPVDYRLTGKEQWLGNPSASGGEVAVTASASGAVSTATYRRSVAGDWRVVGIAAASPAVVPHGAAVPLDAARTAVVTGGSGFLRAGIATEPNGWHSDQILGEFDPYPRWVGPVDPGRGLVRATRAVLTVDEARQDYWLRNEGSAVRIQQGVARAVAWEPRSESGAGSAVAMTVGGETVAFEYDLSGSTVDMVGWYRATPTGPWEAIPAFTAPGAMAIHDVGKIGGRWFAAGSTSPERAIDRFTHAAVWTSADGRTWVPVAEPLVDHDRNSAAVAACELPDGSPLVVGHNETDPTTSKPLAWRHSESGWRAVEFGDLAGDAQRATGCATANGATLVHFESRNGSVVVRTTDGTTWSTVFTTEGTDVMTTPIVVDGGFAAGGGHFDTDYDGPVVWLSADGRDWAPHRIPAIGSLPTLYVMADGPDLIVGLSNMTGHPILSVPGIAAHLRPTG